MGLPRPPKAPLERAAKEAKLVGRPKGSVGEKGWSEHWAAHPEMSPNSQGRGKQHAGPEALGCFVFILTTWCSALPWARLGSELCRALYALTSQARLGR